MNEVTKLTAEALIPTTAAAAATVTGTCVDISQYEGMIGVVQNAAAASAGDTLDSKIQHGDQSNGSDAADLSGATFTQVTEAAAAHQMIFIDSRACKKYIRAIGTIAGNGGEAISFGISIIGQKKIV